MPFRVELRGTLATLLAALLACPPARGLVSMNDGRDRIHVTGRAGLTHDSNVFANANARGDFVYSAGLVAEYTRRAGWIGVDASIAVESGTFSELEEENYRNPSYSLEFTKQSGRTTGALTLHAARESRSDAAVNLRSESWNYASGLNFKYPLVGLYTVSGKIEYTAREYTETDALADLATSSAGVDLLRVLGSERDLVFGYRYRQSETSLDTRARDHSFTVGLAGRLVRGVNGSIRAGYQSRTLIGDVDPGTFGSWTASGSATVALGRKMSLTGQLLKDFSVTASDTSVDATAASVKLQYAYNSRWVASASVGGGRTDFLRTRGRLVIAQGSPPILGPQRADTHATWGTGLNYSLNEHLKVAASYDWYRNWSNSDFADFIRASWNLNVSSRW